MNIGEEADQQAL